MSARGEVLIAIMPNPRDMAFAREEHWYRIPVGKQARLIQQWPPRWVAFYQPKVFGREASAVNYYARVRDIRTRERRQILPGESESDKSSQLYHQLVLEPLQQLSQPIISLRQRRITFILSTWDKFSQAIEINDLYCESSLEDRLWAELKKLQLYPERQQLVTIQKRHYLLDFAVYCADGKIDVETDGDEWHATPPRAELDNLRDNDLESVGWQQLRFTARQIEEQMTDYCLPKIAATINHLGGEVVPDRFMPRKLDVDASAASYQMGLFDPR